MNLNLDIGDSKFRDIPAFMAPFYDSEMFKRLIKCFKNEFIGGFGGYGGGYGGGKLLNYILINQLIN